jgi:RNA polymerase sigma-70 factor (ECF subfamily)
MRFDPDTIMRSGVVEKPRQMSDDASLANDHQLFTRFFAGEDAVLMELFDRHTHRLYLFCLKFLGDRAGAEDLIQDIWEKMIRMRAEGKPVPDNPVGYMITMVRNMSLNRIRDQRPHASLEEIAELEHPSASVAELSYNEELVVAALPFLPDAYREVLVLNAYSGYRFDEIAEMFGEPVGAIRTRAWRARAQLARIISTFMELDEQKSKQQGDDDDTTSDTPEDIS